MIEKNEVIHLIHQNGQIEITSLDIFPGGADPNAIVYKADAKDGKSYFVKQTQVSQIGLEMIELMAKKGIEAIIPPLKTINVKDGTIIVYPFIAGKNGFEKSLTPHQWIELGQTLRKIHDIDVPQAIQKKIRHEQYSSKWRDAVRSIFVRMESLTFQGEMYRFMQEKMTDIEKLWIRADALSQKIKQTSPNVLCHSDIHGGNVLMNDDQSIFIVDWDDPIMAPKERDLMFIGGGIGNVWNRIEEERLFYQGYGATQVDSNLVAYFRHERIIEDIALYSESLMFDPQHVDNEEMLNQFKAMFMPHGVVEIALSQ